MALHAAVAQAELTYDAIKM